MSTPIPSSSWSVQVGSIASVVYVDSDDGVRYVAIYHSPGRISYSLHGGRDMPEGWLPSELVAELVEAHMGMMFSRPVEQRQALIDKCKNHGPTLVKPDDPVLWQPCCLAETRDWNGGCTTCGDPCI